MPVDRFSITLFPQVAKALESHRLARGEDRSSAVNQSLDRYFAILEYTRRKLADQFTPGELGLLLDVFNGTLFAEPMSIQLVWAEVEDSLPDGYAEKWEVDGPALVEKLKALTYAENVTLVDAVERWWERVSSGEQPKPAEALRK